ncbi:MAG: RNA methyltransferase [Myxococcaceae bacterium]|nr:RNA methyltransferase [Myxococcaceae bacterium]
MSGGGPKYERYEREPPKPEELVLDVRKERIEKVIANRTRSFTVVLDRLEDSFNMGAVVRTCEGMGLQEVHVVKNPEAPFLPNTKVTQGCEKWIDVVKHETFAEAREHLKSRGFTIYASAIREDATSLFELKFDRKIALVFGNERHGVSDEVLAGVDGVFWIPMRGFTQSLNVSAAVSASVTRAIAWRAEHLGPAGDLSPEEQGALCERFLLLSLKQRKRFAKAVGGGLNPGGAPSSTK